MANEMVPKTLYDEAVARAEQKERRIGELENQLAHEKKYKMVLSIRSRIEFLEKFLEVPNTDFRTGKSITRREERWLTYFDVKKDDVFAMELKKRVEDQGSSIEVFCKSISVLYGDFSDRAAHRVPLPITINDMDIDQLLKQIGVCKDDPVRIAVNVLIHPLNGKAQVIKELHQLGVKRAKVSDQDKKIGALKKKI